MTIYPYLLRSKGKRRQEMHVSVMDRLPAEPTIEILSRVPAESILQCRLVCKPWRKLLRHPSFAHAHLHQLSQMNGARVGSGLLFMFAAPPKYDAELYYGEYGGQSNKKLRRINQPNIANHIMVGSCNGLICFTEFDIIRRLNIYEPSYISNPITREYMNFPRLEVTSENKIDTMVCGFGYVPSINKFKIVKIYYIQNQPLGRVQVYTLGGGSWKDVGETAYSLRINHTLNRCPYGVFANGALHWLDNEQKIVSFDFVEEKFYLLPSPQFVHVENVTNKLRLLVLGGCLCFVHQAKDKFLDIWFLRKKGESSSYDVNEQEFGLLIWIKEFSIPIVGDNANPIALTRSGEVLLYYKYGLCCYDPKTASFEKILDRCHGLVLPHMNSFVSLKALGEKCRSRKKYKANPSPKEFILKERRNA